MVAVSLEPVDQRPSSLTEIAFDRIRDAIMTKSLAPGTRVSESLLSEMLQVSKTPVREALLRLYHIGLVTPGKRGLHVVTPSAERIRDVYQLRSVLEPVAAQDAGAHATDEQRSTILDAAERSLACANVGDLAGFHAWDFHFHSAIAEAAGNQLLAKVIGDALMLAFTLRERDALTIDDSAYCCEEHVAIATRMATADPGETAKAADLMSTHIQGAMRLVLETGMR